MSTEIMDIDVRVYYITKLKLRLTNLPSTVATISCCPVCKKIINEIFKHTASVHIQNILNKVKLNGTKLSLPQDLKTL